MPSSYYTDYVDAVDASTKSRAAYDDFLTSPDTGTKLEGSTDTPQHTLGAGSAALHNFGAIFTGTNWYEFTSTHTDVKSTPDTVDLYNTLNWKEKNTVHTHHRSATYKATVLQKNKDGEWEVNPDALKKNTISRSGFDFLSTGRTSEEYNRYDSLRDQSMSTAVTTLASKFESARSTLQTARDMDKAKELSVGYTAAATAKTLGDQSVMTSEAQDHAIKAAHQSTIFKDLGLGHHDITNNPQPLGGIDGNI